MWREPETPWRLFRNGNTVQCSAQCCTADPFSLVRKHQFRVVFQQSLKSWRKSYHLELACLRQAKEQLEQLAPLPKDEGGFVDDVAPLPRVLRETPWMLSAAKREAMVKLLSISRALSPDVASSPSPSSSSQTAAAASPVPEQDPFRTPFRL